MADHDQIGPHRPRGLMETIRAAQWSWQGLQAAWRCESSFRTEVYVLVIIAPLAFWFEHSALERVLLIGSWLLVISAELLNSAIEAVIERYGSEWHDLAGRAKDMGSAAVFVLMVNAVMVWGMLLWSAWAE